MQDTVQQPFANAQDIVDSMKPRPSKRYDSLSLSVATLNQQIEELNQDNERLEDNIEVWEAEVSPRSKADGEELQAGREASCKTHCRLRGCV